MVVTYSQTDTLTRAVEKTFDGQHPCSLCKEIAREKGSEQKQDTQIQIIKKLTLHNPAEHLAVFAPPEFSLLRPGNDSSNLIPEQPLLPPPRPA